MRRKLTSYQCIVDVVYEKALTRAIGPSRGG